MATPARVRYQDHPCRRNRPTPEGPQLIRRRQVHSFGVTTVPAKPVVSDTASTPAPPPGSSSVLSGATIIEPAADTDQPWRPRDDCPLLVNGPLTKYSPPACLRSDRQPRRRQRPNAFRAIAKPRPSSSASSPPARYGRQIGPPRRITACATTAPVTSVTETTQGSATTAQPSYNSLATHRSDLRARRSCARCLSDI
jgi:hypothetical protein